MPHLLPGLHLGRFQALLLAGPALLALGGCERNAADEAQHQTTDVFADDDGLPAFTLSPMTLDEMGDFELAGDRRCAFAENPALDPLVVATGFTRTPGSAVQALVKLGGQVAEARVVNDGGQGLDGVANGGSFDTGSAIVDVARITQEPDGSGPAAPGRAMIRLSMAGQEPVILGGYWTCDI